MSEKIVTALGLAAFALTAPALADGGSTPDTSRPLLMAQQNMNPTNDPEVQRGIDQRLEQERQNRINACVQQQEANMDATARAQADDRIRNNCTTLNPAVAAVRG